MDSKEKFLETLEAYRDLGVELKIENEIATPLEVYEKCLICEDMSYMCDFIFKDDEKLKELCFNKVNGKCCKDDWNNKE